MLKAQIQCYFFLKARLRDFRKFHLQPRTIAPLHKLETCCNQCSKRFNHAYRRSLILLNIANNVTNSKSKINF